MTPVGQSKTLLLTGAHGFVGTHVQHAVAAGLFGDVVLAMPPKGWDVRDAEAVQAFIASVRPDFVLHLAAQSFVPRSFADPAETLAVNVGGTLNLLQALQAAEFKGRLLYVSSGDVYGRVPDDELPVTEMRMPEPRSPYAVSKVAAEQLCLQWHRSEGLDVVVARPFNHAGPGQDTRFVLPNFARQVLDARDSGRSFIEVGDIDVTRDFTDVRDVVAAYALIIEKGLPGQTYVVASGQEQLLRDLLAKMSEIAGVAVEFRQDSARLRPQEQRRMVADAARLRLHTGWQPVISLETMLHDILRDQGKEQ